MKEKKYLILYRSIKDKILKGEYRAGEKLPSKRVMCDKTGYSVITVEKSYMMLAEEGYITPLERSGYYVESITMINDGGKDRKLSPINYLPEDEYNNTTEFESSLWFKTVRKVMAEKGEKLFYKSPNKGCAVLRNALSDYLLRYRGMYADPRNIIIGSGAELLYETALKILGRDKLYGIEDPSYAQIEAVYKSEGVKTEKLKMGADGIKKDILESCRADVLHVTPVRSYPSGVTTSVSKKYEYLKWAKDGKYIIEDDFNSEFFIPGQPIETLYSLDTKERVIYINTFSKSLSPSMRMGYMIIPPHIMEEYDKKLGNFSCSVPVFDQYVLTEFIVSGNFERHLNRMRRKMRELT